MNQIITLSVTLAFVLSFQNAFAFDVPNATNEYLKQTRECKKNAVKYAERINSIRNSVGDHPDLQIVREKMAEMLVICEVIQKRLIQFKATTNFPQEKNFPKDLVITPLKGSTSFKKLLVKSVILTQDHREHLQNKKLPKTPWISALHTSILKTLKNTSMKVSSSQK